MIRKIGNFNSINYEFNIRSKKNKIEKNEHLSKVEAIKKAIENGTYKINIHKTAKAMAKALL